MFYSATNIRDILEAFRKGRQTYNCILPRIVQTAARLSNESAKEAMVHGAARRYRIVKSTVDNIFQLWSPNRTKPLSEGETTQICIELHAHYINLFGMCDNLAWIKVHELNKAHAIDRRKVGLYFGQTQALFTKELQEYLNSKHMLTWYTDHVKEFRDCLAHRIPLYVPPYGCSEKGEIMNPFPVFTGSVFNSEVMQLHPQIISNLNSVSEIADKFLVLEFPTPLQKVCARMPESAQTKNAAGAV